MGGILNFPGNEGTAAKAACPPDNPAYTQRYDAKDSHQLYTLAKSVHERSVQLVDFVDSERSLARRSGIETIAIELSSLLEGERFGQVLDALRKASEENAEVDLTTSGANKIRKAEKLIYEASSNLNEFLSNERLKVQQDVPFENRNALGGRVVMASSPQADPSMWIPFIVIGVIGITGVIAITALLIKGR